MQEHQSKFGLPVNMNQITPKVLTDNTHGATGIDTCFYMSVSENKERVLTQYLDKEDVEKYVAWYQDSSTAYITNYEINELVIYEEE